MSTTTNALAQLIGHCKERHPHFLDFLRAHKLSQNGSSKCLRPRTPAQLKSHAYASEITRIELAIVSLESLSGRSRTIPLTAGMAMDDALLALYKAKGAFDCFQNEER